MRLRTTVLLAAAVPVLLISSPALASGGGTVLDWDRRFYLPGQKATARTNVFLGARTAGVDAGPFYAYLVSPEVAGRAWVTPERAARVGRRLGTVVVTQATRKWGRAELSFEVPDVAPGLYPMAYCASPCTGEIVGDIVGIDSLRIESSPFRGFVRERVSGARDRILQSLDVAAYRDQRRARRLENALANQSAALQAVRGRGLRLEAALARVEDRQRRPDPFPLAEVIVAAIAGIGLGGLGGRLRRRRRLDRGLRKLQGSGSRAETETQSVALPSSTR
jgi:hypothetical protein